MPRRILLFLSILIAPFMLLGQEEMRNGRINTCSGTFSDSGGPGNFLNQYQNNEDLTFTICPDDPGRRISLNFSQFRVGDGDKLTFHDGNSRTSQVISIWDDKINQGGLEVFFEDIDVIVQATLENNSGCLTIHWVSDGSDRALGWEAEISCDFKCQRIESQLIASEPPVVPADTGWIDLCLGEQISLSGIGVYPESGTGNSYPQSDATSTFTWDMGDGTAIKGQDATYTYPRAGGYVVELTIKDQLGCRNSNSITQRVRVAPPPTVTTNAIPDSLCIGDTLALSSSIDLEVDTSKTISITPGDGGFQAVNTRADSIALPDGEGVFYESPIRFSSFSPGRTITSADDIVQLCVNMEHTWIRDLEIELICPNGQSVLLHDFQGQEGNEIKLGEPIDNDNVTLEPGPGYTYCWRDDSDLTWLEYAANNFPPNSNNNTLPEREYRPVESFDNLVGCPINGEWTMVIKDLWLWDNGFIYFWSLEFADYIRPTIESGFEPDIVSHQWVGPDAIVNSPDSITAIMRTSGTKTYTFEYEDEFGCTYENEFSTFVRTPDDPACELCESLFSPLPDTLFACDAGETFDLELRAAPGLPSYDDFTYSWQPTSGLSCTDCPNPQITSSTTQLYQVIIDDGDDCVQMDSVLILLDETPPIAIENPDVRPDGCAPGNDGAISIEVTGGTPGYTFLWDDPAGQTIQNISNLAEGTYTVSISDQNPCTEDLTESFQVIEAEPFEISLTAEQISCADLNNGSITASIIGATSGNLTFEWSNNILDSATITGLSPGDYSVVITDESGCSASQSATIEMVEPLVVDAMATPPDCAGEITGQLQFSVSGGRQPYQYQINRGTPQNTGSFFNLAPGNYEYSIQDAEGCFFESMITIEDQPPFSIILSADREFPLELGESVELNVLLQNGNGEIRYDWSVPGIDSSASKCTTCSSVNTQPMRTANAFVEATDENGCIANAQLAIEVDINRSLDVPTGFSPNNDFANDRLIVHGPSGTMVTLFEVYDRWGELLYRAEDFPVNDDSAGWDGQYRGKEMPPGVYIWYVEVTYLDGFEKSFKGQTTLLK